MGGGVAFYFDDDLKLNIKLRPDLTCGNLNIMESLFVQVAQHSTKDIILGVIYRPPNTNVNDFVSEMGVILDRIDRENKPCYLMGDFNIDLLNNNSGTESFLNLMFLHGMYPRIDRPTRITHSSATLIMPCELVRRHIPSCSSKFDVKIQNLEILDVGDYNISETITTTETWVAPFGSVTLAVELS